MGKNNNPLDLKVLFPDYNFNRMIFRIGILLVVILALSGWALDDFRTTDYFSLECAGSVDCSNPFFIDSFTRSLYPDYECPLPSDYEFLCSMEVIPAGSSYGEKPNFIVANIGFLAFIIVFLCFLANHLLYNRRFKN